MELPLLHHDDSLVVVDKPAGLLAVPGRGPEGERNLVALLAPQVGPLHVVHRLDQATSGLMVLARSLEALRPLHQAFAQRQVHKRYAAVVHGRPAADAGEIRLPLAADWPNRPRQRVDMAQGKPSHTLWWRQACASGESEPAGRCGLTLEPRTGRSHQLRVHLAAIGHGIVGDRLYGQASDEQEPRLLLHATELGFDHPVTGTALRFVSVAPF